ncbi:MAG TPA: class I SAM-dependent methyltransferase [Rhizomicrobium sp.]|nr:class I SAM-dependent methyltransferase [Rhizomicrobium sp.]
MTALPVKAQGKEIPLRAVPACPVCGESGGVRIAQGQDYEMQTCANLWPVLRCARCGAARLDPRPDDVALPVIYPPTYYSYAMSETLSPLVLWGKSVLDRLKFGAILRALARPPASFLDIGCGDGHYLDLMAKRGIKPQRIFGIEMGASEKLRNKGFCIFDGRVEDCEIVAPGSLDLVTMFHVIEHVADPVLVLARVRDWLSPDGVLALETPNLDSLDARLFRARWWGGYHFPRHWVLFDPASIRKALEKAGLEMLAIRYQTGHSFWLYSFHHLLRYNARFPMPRLARLFDPLRSKLMLILFTGLDILRRSLGMKTSAMLVLARRPR